MDLSTDNDGGDGKQLILSNNYNNNSRTQIRQMQRTQITQQPRQILDEEEYTDTLSHIVTRDYFPSLPSLRRDAAILDARSRGDISGAVAVRRMARKDEMEREKEWKEEMEQERAATTSVTETSLMSYTNQNNNAKIHVRKRPRPLKHETITGFHSRVTSEDNAEFECNQERERKEREERLGVIYASHADRKGRLRIEACMNGTSKNIEEEASSNNNAARALLCDTPIGLSSDLYDAPPSAGLRITDSDGNDKEAYASNNGIGRNGLFFQPLHRSSNDNRTKTSSEKLLLTSSEGGPSSAGTFLALENNNTNAGENTVNNEKIEINDKSDNLLMPPPPSRLPASSSNAVVLHQKSNGEPSSTTNNAKSIDDRCQLVEYLPKPTLPDIYPPATRFPYQNESRLLAKNNNNTAYNRRGSIQSMGSFTDASETTDLDSSPRSLERERAAYKKARTRENETFVAMTPLIYPGGGGGNGRNNQGEAQSFGVEPNEPIMTWGDVQSTPLVLGNGAAVDARAETSSTSAADWEPTYPSSLLSVGNGDADSESSSLPSFDVVDDNRREVMARRAEKGLLDRAKTYRSGSSNSNKRRKDDDDQSVRSSQSSRSITSTTPFDRKASLTPAARALLEASNNAHQSKKKKSGSRLFQGSSTNPGASSSFGSSLRMSYTPSVSSSVGGKKKRSSSSSISSLRRAAGGATPRCHKA